MDENTDKRSYHRYRPNNDQPLGVDLNGPDFLEVLEAYNIGEGGVGIEVPYGFDNCAINEPVSVILQFPEPIGGYLSTKGIISHVSGAEFGVSFVDLSTQDRHRLRRYLQTLV